MEKSLSLQKNYHIMRKLLSLILAGAIAAGATAQNFDDTFTDATLRLDYIFGGKVTGDSTQCTILLDGMAELPGWAGRKNRLKELPLEGNGQVTVTDERGDTLYRTSFSSLFHEWLATEEAAATPRGFQNTFLVPMPKEPVTVEVKLLDNRHRPMAAMSHRVDPADILIAKKGTSHVTPHRYIHRSSRPDEAIDVAIMAEGYTVEEMDSFYRHAAIAVESILNHEPFKEKADCFNFVAVASPSLDSGLSIPRLGEWRKTAVGSHFSTFYSDRYLTTRDLQSMHDALAGIPYEHIIILANTDEYGGGGIYNSYTLTTARHRDFRPVVVHEFGHSFGGLADEYFYENDALDETYATDVEPWEPNLTTLHDFGSKWQGLLAPGTPVPTLATEADKWSVGVFEGGGYRFKGIYRPADECRMRNNTYPTFCPACRAALTALINFYTE